MFTVNFTTEILPSCCVWSWTLSRSRGCVQQHAIADAMPPKYHLDTFCSFDIEIIRKLAQIRRPLVACARRHFEVMFAKNAFNFYVKRAQVDSPWSGQLEAYSLRFPAGGHARDRYHSRRPQRPINPPHVTNFRQFDTCTAANPSRLETAMATPNPLLVSLDIKATDKVISIKENGNIDSNFVITHLIKQILLENNKLCFVILHNTLGHYHNVGKRLGYDFLKRIEDGSIRTIEPLKEIVEDIGNGKNYLIDDKEHIVKALYTSIKQNVEELTSTTPNRVYLIIDDVSHLLDLGIDLKYIISFITYCLSLVNNDKVSVVVNTHVCSKSDEIICNNLNYVSDVIIEVLPLKTGISREVTGVMSIEKSGNAQIAQFHFKAYDKGIKTFHLGDFTICKLFTPIDHDALELLNGSINKSESVAFQGRQNRRDHRAARSTFPRRKMTPETTPSSSGSDTSKRQTKSAERLMVAVRIRPLRNDEPQRALYAVNKKNVVLEDNDRSDVLRQKRGYDKQYNFDVVFGEDSTQEEVYEVTTNSLVKDVLNG
ncbi:hypothetical protein GEV33_009364 [Tenebrio molitor]|uniref:Elongator complex protein 6 n=1 Tax=Tenebrio molitor TaxID=7067 RepID=A0A8J6LAS3_TENMO|nr:hypothetical protein GEV33_009364 [Tenebrio molitor]